MKSQMWTVHGVDADGHPRQVQVIAHTIAEARDLAEQRARLVSITKLVLFHSPARKKTPASVWWQTHPAKP
jgi:hypothetical protein